MHRKEHLKILIVHIAIIFLSQLILVLLLQLTMQFVILQDRLSGYDFEGKSFNEIQEIQRKISVSLEEDLKKNPDAIVKRYYEIVFQERHGVLFWSSLMWAVAFLVPGFYILGKKMEIPISKLEDELTLDEIAKGILSGIGVFAFVSALGAALNLIGMKPKNNEFQILLYNNLKGNPYLLAWSLYSVGLITGIIEEWFFRGMILRHYISKGSIKEGWLISSVLFGAMHYSPDASLLIPVILSGVGVLFGYLYIRYQNIWVPIASHAAYNSIILFLAYFFGDLVS